jgi:hypothetical protein
MEHSAVVPQLVALTQKNQLKGGGGPVTATLPKICVDHGSWSI